MLSPQQIDARRGKLTASRVAALVTGDRDKIMRLWREMLGIDQEEDLSNVWPVQLGAATEVLNLRWYAMKNSPVTRCGEVVEHPVHDWAAATLDGWDSVLNCPVECKHVGGHEPLEIIIDRYQPQMQWQMECTGAAQCAISVIMGAREPVVEYVEYDAEYAAELVKRGEMFMQCVRERRDPVVLEAVAAPAIAETVYDMSTSNQWCSYAVEWLETRDATKRNEDASKLLKAMVPDDAKRAFGAGVRISRDRAGRLSLREDKS